MFAQILSWCLVGPQCWCEGSCNAWWLPISLQICSEILPRFLLVILNPFFLLVRTLLDGSEIKKWSTAFSWKGKQIVICSDFFVFWKGLLKCRNNLFWLEAGDGLGNVVLFSDRNARLLIFIAVFWRNRGLACTVLILWVGVCSKDQYLYFFQYP